MTIFIGIYTHIFFFFFNEMNVSHKLPIIYKKIRIYIYINHFIRHYMARCLSLLLVESTPPANKNSLVSSARGREKCCSRSRSGKKLESKLLSEIIQSPSPSLFSPLHLPPPKKKKNEGGGGRKNSGLDRNQNKHDHRRNKKYDIFGRNWPRQPTLETRHTSATQSGVSLCYRTRQRVAVGGLFRSRFTDLSLCVCVCVCYINDTRACARARGRRVPFSSTIATQPSARSIKPISTALLYQSASLLSCCSEEEFYREFLFARLKNFPSPPRVSR